MSAIQIDPNPDLRRLLEDGYNIQITSGNYLVVHDVPYVNSRREIAYGTLGSNLSLAGDLTAKPEDHTAKFVGDYPCDEEGKELEYLRQNSAALDLGSGLIARHSFSRKPKRGYYLDYYEKMTAYVGLLIRHAASIDPTVTARTHKVIQSEDDRSPFTYVDANSANAEINAVSAKLVEDAVAIVGLGGTGSYVLDQIAKTPVKAIHLFDADRFLTHNAFRAPGAPLIEELRKQRLKVDYFAEIYSRMHRGIVAHRVNIDASNVELVTGMSFVFICMEGGAEKRALVDVLEARGIPFVDVGMSLYAKRSAIGGLMRSVISLTDGRDGARTRISFAADEGNNEYDKNIQIADLNAMNACLAVIAWKKHRGFYVNQGKERFVSYSVGNSLLSKGDIL